MTSINTEHNANLSFLPDPGEGRWWRVIPNPKSQTKPIAIQLMESHKPGHKPMSRVLNIEYTIAAQRDLAEAAALILLRIADYKLYLGDHGLAPGTK